MRSILLFTTISVLNFSCNNEKISETVNYKESAKDSIPTVKNLKTGRIWMDRNLGASQVAMSPNDTLAFGDLYQWGRQTDGHEKRTSSVTLDSCITDIPGHNKFIMANYNGDWRNEPNDKLWTKFNVNNVCPIGFHIPTREEWETEMNTWKMSNSKGAFNSILKLPLAGMRGTKSKDLNEDENYSSEITGEGVWGEYWSSESTYRTSFLLYIGPEFNLLDGGGDRWSGRSVRCIKNLK
jgi:uncharacterized protein (TIGR02145 family)